MSGKIHLSIVSPVYEAENIVDVLVKRIVDAVSEITLSYEVILIEDGSRDKSWIKIEENCKNNKKVKGIKLSRNFGQHYAVTAGLEQAEGDYCIIMDCDLQDDPNHIRLLYNKAKEGYDIVFTIRNKRQHSVFKKTTAFLFNKLYKILVGNEYDINVGSLVLFTDSVRDAFLKIKDVDRLYIQILKWVGYHQTSITVDHRQRYSGKTTYSFYHLLRLAVQAFTSHSDKLLKYSIYLGFTFSISSLIGVLIIIYLYFSKGFQSGWASLAVLNIFSFGIVLLSIGVVGVYLGKVFAQTKGRPLYVVEKLVNKDKPEA